MGELGVEYCNIVRLSPPAPGTLHIPTIVHDETTFGPEKCVAHPAATGPGGPSESSTFQSIKCVICNLKCSAKTLQHTSES